MTNTTDNRIATYNGNTVTYDADGNMTYGPLTDDMYSFSYDCRNRLTGAGSTSYSYDAENNRIGVSVNSQLTSYVVNPNAALSQVLIKTDPDGTRTWYVYGLGLIGEECNGVYRNYHYDLRGSTVALTSINGTILERFQYGSYGEIQWVTGYSNIPFLYNGRDGVVTDENGLYYMRARYYNPEIKRFMSRDEIIGNILDPMSLNRYAYVKGNPVIGIDPLGYGPDTPDQYYSGKTIVIDPGHGGNELGAIRNYNGVEYYEKDINLSIATELKLDLEAKGAKVIMTRETDVDVSLNERYNLANSSKADLFISVHTNSSNLWFKNGTTVVYPNNHDIDESKALALAVNGSVFEWTSLNYRDPYKDNRGLAVLRGTNMPAIITETGYLSSNDFQYVINNTKNIADSIEGGIHDYYFGKCR